MTKIILYGGVNEIGGNKVLIEDKDTSIFLDFGMSYSQRGKFYSDPWISPRDESGLLEFGILPKIEGIYRFDGSKPSIDALFLSHAHTDHYKYISFLNRDIPMYCGQTTKILLDIFSQTRTYDFEHDLSGITWNTFKTGDKIRIGSMEIEPIHVDHSIPAAYGFLVHTTEGTVAYTGDFRTHGTNSGMTKDFVEKTRDAKPEILLCEGTTLGRGEVITEDEVKRKISVSMDGSDGIVLSSFSMADVDRLRTFYEVACANKRVLAISLKQAYLLKYLKNADRIQIPDVEKDDNLVVYRRQKKTYYKWEQEVLSMPNVVDADDVSKHQSKYILVLPFTDLKELVDIKPDAGSCYLYSSSEPFNEEMEIEFDKLVNWLDHFGLPLYHAHASGHIMPNELRGVISTIQPRKTVPIHTEHAEMFAKWCGDKTEFLIPQKDIPIIL